MTTHGIADALSQRLRIATWIGSNSNLWQLRKRLKRELAPPAVREFYRIWLYGQVSARIRAEKLAHDLPSPLTVKMSPTQRCNLRCQGCFASNYEVSDRLDPETMRRVVSQSRDIGVHTVGVIGGEPLLLDDIWELFVRFPDVGFFLVTNGTLVTPQVVERLQRHRNVVPIFSLEGYRQTTDSLRGEGVFDRIVGAMWSLKRAGVLFGSSTVFHTDNLDEVISEHYLDFLIAQGCYVAGFLAYIPVGEAPAHHRVPDLETVRSAHRRLDRAARGKPVILLKEGYSDGTFMNQGCRAASTIHVTADGDIEPCNGIQFATHNVFSSTLREALTSPYFADLRALHPDRRRCLVNTDPQRVLDVVRRHGAAETHAGALEHLRGYAEHVRCGVLPAAAAVGA